MKKIKLLGWALMALASFSACTNDAEEVLTKESEIKLTSEITPSRAASNLQSTQIVAGQKVGVTITGAKSEDKNVAWNVGEEGELSNTGDPVYYGDGAATITAYHPFNDDWDENTSYAFSVSTDQSENADYLNSDLLWATATSSKTENPVPLTFSHKLAKINVTLVPENEDDYLNGATISIYNTKTSTTFNPTTGVISDATGEPQEIIAGVTADDVYTASAIVIPQEVSGKFIKITHEGKTYYYTLASGKTLKSGHSYSYTLTVKGKQLISTNSSINDWNDESGNIGDAEEEGDTEEEEVAIPYLTFTADAEQTLTMSKAVETLEYSVNGGEWKELGTSKVTFGGENGNLRLRGKNNFGTARGWLDYSKIQFGRSNSVSCSGDIRTLLDYENYLIVDTKNARFCYLFEWCYELISAPKLPLEILASECYREMFSGCTNLTEAPELPATTLNSGCYYGMFQDCSNLTKAPELPATTLRSSCYSRMFQGCSNLTKAPELSATLLGSGCYDCMFRYCTNLIEAPELPATTLTEGCYEGMFIDCTSLAEAPVLPATTLTERCYSAMFAGCSKLTVAPKLPATNLATECYFMMFQETGLVKAPELPATYLTTGCYNNMFAASNLAIAPELPATNLANECYLGMFGGCTNLTIAPKLPATNLASQCYYKMFSNCTSLTEASVLPATILAYQCYYRMFESCIQLNTITMLATNITASECLYNWVEGVASTGTFTKAKEMESLPSSYNGIPYGWSVKNYSEE